ncbi:YhgE/Pip domain-containing protein [Bifidobacterium callimiconis]|uniref:YhgE/Pip domain-containing protein n=1 Tax=Bifidobacterium callimiconis TaxID=2306973 RepID=UPI001BDC44C2|nr:YhgE/Pip domain-containing protein [Bifidobacterium callimiconis]MBT1177717.1 YhgE/Pip domain-containing protein [Bifidobacterium callimiconis]
MRNILQIFTRDVRNAVSNVIGVIVTMGLVIVPSLYAWFNIAASWNPYDNTASLKVAVASADAGYKSDLIPVKINVGETVISTLRANHQLDWVFTDPDSAEDGVRSGDYYAAIVIPRNFSADMMTLFSPKVKHAKLKYYTNEKINAIAPHVTDEGADTIADQIDSTFAKTIGQVGLDLATTLAKYAQGDQMQNYVANATGHIDAMGDQLTSASAQTASYSKLLASTESIIDSTSNLIDSSGKTVTDAKNGLKQAQDGVTSLDNALNGTADTLGSALSQSEKSYDSVSGKVDTAFDAIGTQSDAASKQLTALSGKVSGAADGYQSLIDALNDMKTATGSDSSDVQTALDDAITAVTNAQKAQKDLAGQLSGAAGTIGSTDSDITAKRNDLKNQIAAAKKSVTDVKTTYDNGLKPKLAALADSIDTVSAQTRSVADGVSATVKDLKGVSGNADTSIAGIRKILDRASERLGSAGNTMHDLSKQIAGIAGGTGASGDSAQGDSGQNGSGQNDAGQNGSGDSTSGGSDAASSPASQLGTLANLDPDALATLLSSPVSVNRVAVYHIANYGSAMAPFYTILAIWVGSIILVAMMKVAMSERGREEVLIATGEPRLRLHQQYFGRYLFFMLLALLQGALVALGDLYYLGIQSEHPMQFLLVCEVAAVVFSNITYTLALSFGDIGKAIAVVLLVMQVAGSGGTFPIETLPPVFRALYPFLPFPHGIAAMHAAMAGAFGAEFWRETALLAVFIVPSLLLGLVLRKPVIRLNDWIIRNLESTKLM